MSWRFTWTTDNIQQRISWYPHTAMINRFREQNHREQSLRWIFTQGRRTICETTWGDRLKNTFSGATSREDSNDFQQLDPLVVYGGKQTIEFVRLVVLSSYLNQVSSPLPTVLLWNRISWWIRWPVSQCVSKVLGVHCCRTNMQQS